MSTVSRTSDVSPEQVWSVLADGWHYGSWVVGAARIRDVDEGWPAVGTRIHHSVGTWPLLLDDHTEVLECDPLRRLVLKARAWPAGEAKVSLTLTPSTPSGGVDVEMWEDATSGPGALVPRPVREPLISARNTEALRRLLLLATGR